MKIQELKEELKVLVVRIRKLRAETKQFQKNNNGIHGISGCMLRNVAWEFRHKHIAYCLLRGRMMGQIENKNRPQNKPDMNLVNQYMEKYNEKNVCVN